MPAIIVKVAPLDGANLLDVARALPYGKALGISPSEKLHVELRAHTELALDAQLSSLAGAYLAAGFSIRIE